MKNLFFLSFFLIASFQLMAQTATDSKKKLSRTSSGYEYVHHVQNKGPHPKAGDQIVYHQAAYKNDSLLFSNFDKPVRAITIPDPSKLPTPTPADYEALLLMSVGDSVTVYMRLDSMEQLPPEFLKTDTIIYVVKLVSLKTKEDIAKEGVAIKAQEKEVGEQIVKNIKIYNAGLLKDLITTASGMKYIVHKEGEGAQAVAGNGVDVLYYGATLDGKEFDNCYKKGTSFSFGLGRGEVIKGWDEAVALMKVGGSATFFIPYQLAYGEEGRPPSIPAKAELVFFIELKSIK